MAIRKTWRPRYGAGGLVRETERTVPSRPESHPPRSTYARRASGDVWNERGVDVRASAESHRIVERVRDHAHDRQAARVEDGRVRGAGDAEPGRGRHREEGKEGTSERR